MKKLRLELDLLSVESFHIPSTGRAPGTVRANAEAAAWTPGCLSFWLFGTCAYSCAESCTGTCNTPATCGRSCADTNCANLFCRNTTETYVSPGGGEMDYNTTIPMDY